MQEKISKINEIKTKRKILKICDIFLASFLSLVILVSVMSLTIFLNTSLGLSFLNCMLISGVLTYLSSCGVNSLLKPLDDKCKKLSIEIKKIEEEYTKKLQNGTDICDVRLRFEGLSVERKKQILNYIREKACNEIQVEEITAIDEVDILALFNEKENKRNASKKTGYSKKRSKR